MAVVRVFGTKRVAATLRRARTLQIFRERTTSHWVFQIVRQAPSPFTVANVSERAIEIIRLQAVIVYEQQLIQPGRRRANWQYGPRFTSFVTRVSFQLRVRGHIAP